MFCDRLIIGAGLYGLYSALKCGKNGQKVIVLERDNGPFMRATYINQARVHMGYHYPRSYSTAIKSSNYFDRFVSDYGFCIKDDFDQIYATSSNFSWTNANEFKKFCNNANIRCDSVDPELYFKPGMCDGAFFTKEYTYDAQILKEYFIQELDKLKNVEIFYNHKPEKIARKNEKWEVLSGNLSIDTPFILNATYAGVNDIHKLLGLEPFNIKYEKCEIILCEVSEKYKNVGITVMDGPFFSIMPFGKTGLHSLTSVTFTPHETCYSKNATFSCQQRTSGKCCQGDLYNCDLCGEKPDTAWDYMSQLAKKYLKDDFEFKYHSSLFSMKPILLASEIDDSRPTVIKKMCEHPTLVSVLSGKINTVYDLDEVLTDE